MIEQRHALKENRPPHSRQVGQVAFDRSGSPVSNARGELVPLFMLAWHDELRQFGAQHLRGIRHRA
jgi:hypothetical protein